MNVPQIGQTFSRDLMPQIDDPVAFMKYLKKEHGIDHIHQELDTQDLSSTQSEFDHEKILKMMNDGTNKSIVVSNDGYVVDGHHRWLADHNTTGKTKAFIPDVPVLELYRLAKEYNNQLKEEMTLQKFQPMLDTFISFAKEKLNITELPQIKYKDVNDDFSSFGGYNPSEKSIIVVTKNRHPNDVFRTLAHELVHHKQNEDGRIKDVAKEGSTGSNIEDEANSMAGQILRFWAADNPDSFRHSALVEELEEESLHDWFSKSKSKDGKPGWVQIGGKYHLKPCARQEGQTSVPKCRPSSEAKRMTKKQIKYAVSKKRREDPGQTQKTNGAKPTKVATYKEVNEEKDACYKKVKSRYRVFPSAYASGALVKCRKVGAKNWGNSVNENTPGDREWGTTSLTRIYADATPGQTFPINPLFEKKQMIKIRRKRRLEEDGVLGSTLDGLNTSAMPYDNGIGATFGTRYSGSIGYSPVNSGLGIVSSYPTDVLAESIRNWIEKPETQEYFVGKYGELAEQKLIEIASNLNQQLNENWEAIGKRDMGTVPYTHAAVDEDWQKVNRQDKTDGLSQKAVNAYRRENPGSKLQTAVTEKNPKGKRAKRRLSFCRRMSGVKGPMKDEKGTPTPKALALRRWNCEE
jgi:hypothetical protein